MIGKLYFKVALFFVCFFGFILYTILIPKGSSETIHALTIEQGTRVGDIANELKKSNLIRSSLMFKVYVQLSGSRNKLQAGYFDLNEGMNIPSIVRTLKSGTFDKKITILEGWRLEEIADYLNKVGFGFSSSDFVSMARPYEGKLFPDTYIIPRYSTAQNLIDTMMSNFNSKVDANLRNDIDNSSLSLEQTLIFASIVERETLSNKDRPVVAGILLKRYQEDWPLQSDVTTQYAIGYINEVDPKTGQTVSTWWKRDLSLEDTLSDSPYNTRVQTGLPPTPICNPGLDSIRAVVYPQETPYWYYLSDKNGNMHYAITLEEHQNNIAQYLQ